MEPRILYYIYLISAHCIYLQAQPICSLQESCDDCLSAGIECIWCADMILNNSTNRCATRDSSIQCNNIQDFKGNYTVLQDEPFSQLVQIRPQRIRVRLRPGESIHFNATVKPAPNFPLDLYYLMDLSFSMRDDLNNLRSLSVDIATRINNISSDSQLGFGSFVDKPFAPYISTTISNLLDPCNDMCEPAYSFHHVLNLTNDTDRFQTLIAATMISGNQDVPEGSMDALLQATVCTDIIGWRKRARHLLLMATDADFHGAGDGKLGGIVRPHDGECHLTREMDQLFTYTEAGEFDYPSVYQINDNLIKNDIVPLFAVTNRGEYDRLVSNDTQQGPIDNLYIGLLAEDSRNVVELIENAYRSIAETIQVRNGTAANLRIIANATCPTQTQDGQCTGVTIGTEATYDISVELLDCSIVNDQNLRFIFYGDILIEIEPVCSCECSSHPSMPNSFCNNETLVCGQCICNGRQGNRCECPSSQNTFANNELCLRSNSSQVLCSNRGSCLCGQCVCEIQQNPEDRVYGQFCECDNFNCPRGSDNAVCGGMSQGRCECGVCVCSRHPNGGMWTRGSTGVCDCTPDQEPCRAANGQVCAGNGNCICGRCNCPSEYTIASNCLSCNDPMTCNALCINYYECITCYREKGDNCRCGNETEIPVIFINQTLSGNYEIDGIRGTPCLVTIDGCATSFFVAVDRLGSIHPIHVQLEPICNSPFTLWYVPPLAVLFALIIALIITLLVVKLILVCLDVREYRDFTKNLHLDTQNMNENPLYRKEAAEVGNPIYNQMKQPNIKPLF